MKPINDVLKVEVSSDEYGFGGDEKPGVEHGIVVAVSEIMPYFGFHSFAFEDSFNAKEAIAEIRQHYERLVGKRVYWTQYAERGMVLKEGDKSYAFIKCTDLIAFSDPDKDAYAVNIENGGSFTV